MTYLPSIDSMASEPWNAGEPGADAGAGTLFGRSFPARGTERAALLLVHGFGEHHGRYARQIEHLAEAGVTVFAFDDVFCSVVRRVALPDAFFALEGQYETFLTVLEEFGAYPAVIDKELQRYPRVFSLADTSRGKYPRSWIHIKCDLRHT